MGIHIVVDGYNLIRQSAALRAEERLDVERGRRALNRRLARYQKIKGHRVTVIFDGAGGRSLSRVTVREEGIRTIYSGQRDSADDIIMRMAAQQPGGMVVVTSDRGVADYVTKRGATVISSPEFEARMESAGSMDRPEGEEKPDDTDYEGRITTRKKGPSRKLPRKKRRVNSRVRKL
ncbi:MAG: NYN domain-containing protein [Deltaproteobacteria bacterium]|nr:NYN domain-containing protein [Deltaproteobacteria bacterium]